MRVFSKNGVQIPHGKGRLDRSFSLSAATKNSLSAQALHTPNSPKKNAEFALNSTLSPSKTDRKNHRKQDKISFRVHPLFFLVGIWYACTGELFLFLLSGLVAVQHELAHAFAAAKLGYKLNSIVLMPFGAVIDGDLEGLTAKDEILVAFWGPFCNLLTAVFFVALWWFAPTMYAFTDVVFYSSLAIALVNLLPAYPLDGGRILRCFLTRFFAKSTADLTLARRRAEKNMPHRHHSFFFGVFCSIRDAVRPKNAQSHPFVFRDFSVCRGAWQPRQVRGVFPNGFFASRTLSKGDRNPPRRRFGKLSH